MTDDRIARGCRILDEACPGWHAFIDLDTLDISSLRECVLGQLYGDFHTGRAALGLSAVDAEAAGFVDSTSTAAWRQHIATLQAS